MDSRLLIFSLLWSCLCLGVYSLQAPMVMRLPRSPQMPPTVAARQPSRSKSILDAPVDSIQLEQKSSNRHPYLTRYVYNEDQKHSTDDTQEWQKRSAMPSSPFVASRISPSERKTNSHDLYFDQKYGEHSPPKMYFPKLNNKKSSMPERSIKKYYNKNNKVSQNQKDIYLAGSYPNVLNKMNITNEEVRSILQKKGVIFEEFINFVAGGASMEQVKQILYITELEGMRLINKTKKTNKLKPFIDNTAPLNNTSLHLNRIPWSKNKGKRKFDETDQSESSGKLFDANALPSKDSPMIAHFRKPHINNKDIGSAAILSFSIEEKQIELNPQSVTKGKAVIHPHISADAMKNNKNYQSDQATPSQTQFRFEDGLRMFLIICGGIGGIILLATIILVMYNVLTCKESRMAQRNYELGKQIRSVDESLEIC